MRFESPLIRLPYRFDAERASTSARAVGAPARRGQPIAQTGLVSGQQAGRLGADGALKQAPALAGLLAAPGAVIGHSRLLWLATGGRTPLRHDLDEYWHKRARMIYVLEGAPLLRSGEREVEAPAGTVWLIDGWRGWQIAAGRELACVLMMVDTVGSAAFWSLVASADRPDAGDSPAVMSTRTIGLDATDPAPTELETETVTTHTVLAPAELNERKRIVLDEIREVAEPDGAMLARLTASLDSFQRQWQAVWARFGEGADGREARIQTLEQAWAQISQFAGHWPLANGVSAADRFYWLVFADALRDADGRAIEVVPEDQARLIRERSGSAASGQAQAAPGAATPQSTERATTEAAGASPRKPAVQDPNQPPPDPEAPLRSVHTKSFPELLRKLGASLLVTTYQAGKLAILRENDGVINTHFHVYQRPMGLAADNGRLAVGTASAVEEYRNMSDVASKLDPPGRHDAAYLPRNIQITGNIDIHEMAYGDEGLWLVNTRFSCLCTLNGEHSFVPRWRPKFISGYAPEDRCHLNGLEMVNGKPKYVTALGSTDTAGGWRDNKAGGGVLIDVDSGEFICRGLSMPHSPRWYDGRLWVLESGNGSLATVDPDSGQLDTVVELPGFTRGLDFFGPFAFVGLSQVRESAVFAGIRLTERVDERCCGVWVVDLRSAKIVAFLRFEDAVQEVFAVSVLPGQRYPDVLGVSDPRVPVSYALPDEALAAVIRPVASGAREKEGG